MRSAAVSPAPPVPSRRRQAITALARVLTPLNTAALWLAGIGLVVMTAFVAYQVWGRYVLNSTPAWTESGSILLMSWFIMLGAAVGVREDVHLGFDILRHVAPAPVRRAMALLSSVLVGFFGALMAIYGYQLTVGTWAATLPTLGLPGGVDYLPLVVGGVLITLFSAERLLKLAILEEV